MRQILDTELYVQVPPMMLSDPFYRITYLIKEEIRKYKWIEGEKGRQLTWDQARIEWMKLYRKKFEKFFLETPIFPEQKPEYRKSLETGGILPECSPRRGDRPE